MRLLTFFNVPTINFLRKPDPEGWGRFQDWQRPQKKSVTFLLYIFNLDIRIVKCLIIVKYIT